MIVLKILLALVAGALLWSLGEYVLHRFAMHHLHGKGIMSREHLEHHVHASWSFDVTHLLSWTGMLIVGFAIWNPLTQMVAGPAAGWSLAVGWALGYFFYEYQHMTSHLRAPSNRYGAWLRKHHFHHHFGHPMKNHGVTTIWWDKLFGSYEEPGQVRVPRRMALPWLLDSDGEVLAEYRDDYRLVGKRSAEQAILEDDRTKAFASVAPVD